MYSKDKEFQLLELEFARLETKLARHSATPQKIYHKHHHKPRWSLDDLRSETKYLDNLARKALSPVRFYPPQPELDLEENLSRTYPKITEPHRIDPKVTVVEVNNKDDRIKSRNNELSDFKPTAPINLMTEADISFGFKPKQKKHQHKHREPVYKIRKSPEKQYPHKTAKAIVLGTPPEAGLDAVLDTFIDNIQEVGKWAE